LYQGEELREIYLRKVEHLEFLRSKSPAFGVHDRAPWIRLKTLELGTALFVYDPSENRVETAVDLLALYASYDGPGLGAVSADVMTEVLHGLRSDFAVNGRIAIKRIHGRGAVAAVVKNGLRTHGPALSRLSAQDIELPGTVARLVHCSVVYGIYKRGLACTHDNGVGLINAGVLRTQSITVIGVTGIVADGACVEAGIT